MSFPSHFGGSTACNVGIVKMIDAPQAVAYTKRMGSIDMLVLRASISLSSTASAGASMWRVYSLYCI